MPKFIVTLPDGKTLEAETGASIGDVVKSIGMGLFRDSLAAHWNGVEVDLSFKPQGDGALKVVTSKSPEALEIIRHSTAHLMAHAVTERAPLRRRCGPHRRTSPPPTGGTERARIGSLP